MKIYNGIIKENNLELDLAFIGHILSIEQILFLMKSLSPNFVEKRIKYIYCPTFKDMKMI